MMEFDAPSSLQKRKRTFGDHYPAHSRWNRATLSQISTDIIVDDSLQIKFSFLLDDHGFCMADENHFYYCAQQQNGEFGSIMETDSLIQTDDLSVVRLKKGNSHDHLVIVGAEGSLQFWSPSAGNKSSSYNVVLDAEDDEDEQRIVDAAWEGTDVILLSSRGSIYILKQVLSGKIECFLLQKTVSLMQGLLLSGAQLLGVGNQVHNQQSVTLLLDQTQRIAISVGSTLSAWRGYNSPGREQLLLEVALIPLIKADINALTSSTLRLRLVDSSLLQTQTEGFLTIMTLTAATSAENNEDTNDNIVAALWVHILSISLTKHEKNPITIITRYHIANAAVISHDFNAISMPRLFTMPKTWRVYAIWIEYHSSNVQCIQLDVLHHTHDGRSENGLVNIAHMTIKTDVHMDDIGSISCSLMRDGIMILHQDLSMVTLVTPPLANDPSNSAAATISSMAIVGLELRQETSRLVSLLTSITHGREHWSQHIGYLRNAFLYLPKTEVVQICSNLSYAIINRNPAGRYWGSAMSLRTSGTSDITGENQLNELQFAHRVIDEKLIAHGLLLKTLTESDVMVDHAVLINHLKVALCAGLAEATEQQPQDSQHENIDLQDAIRALTWSIEQAVKQTYTDNLHEISSKGLTLYDQFFAEVDKAVDIFSLSLKLVCQHVQQCTKGGLYKLLFLYHTAMKLTIEKSGFENSQHDIHYHPLMMRSIRSMMTTLCGEIAVVFASSQLQQQLVEAQAPERQRIGDFCAMILTSYEMEGKRLTNTTDLHTMYTKLPLDFKQEFQRAKEQVIGLLLALPFHRNAFVLSEQFMYFHGLFEACAMAPQVHILRLEQIIREHKDFLGTDTICLAMKYFLWLEKKRRLQDLLAAGILASDLFTDFLQDNRAYLSMIYSIQTTKNYVKAARAGLHHSQYVSDVDEAKTTLSLAKLAGYLHQTKPATTIATEAEASIAHIMSDIDLNSNVLLVQQQLAEIMPDTINLQRGKPLDLVKHGLQFLHKHAESAAISVEEKAMVASKCLVVLGLSANFFIKAGKGHNEALIQQGRLESASLTTDLWTLILSIDGPLFLEISLAGRIGQEEEKVLRKETILYKLTSDALAGLQEGTLLQDMLPIDSERLQKLVVSSGLTRKDIDMDGNIINLSPSQQSNERVRTVVQECVKLAEWDFNQKALNTQKQ